MRKVSNHRIINQPMKKLVVLILLAASISTFGQTEEITPKFTIPRTLIKIAPLQFFSNTLELGIESFNKDFSRSFEGSIGFRSGSGDFDDGNGMSAEIGYRRYVSPMKIRVRKERQFYQGIYYNVAFRAGYFNGTHNNYSWYDPNTGTYHQDRVKESVRFFAPSFTLGLQKTLWQIIFLDVFIGGGIRFSEIERSNSNPDVFYFGDRLLEPGYDGIFPKIGAKIGVGL